MPVSEFVLLLMTLLALGMVTAGLFRRLPIPYTVLLVVIGGILGQLAQIWPPLAPLREFELTPELVLFIFLPTLIFESGLNLNARQLVRNLAPVLILAVPGMLVSAFLVGFGLYEWLGMSLAIALVFGALISATDPVAVVALFKELGTPERLTVLVEGESLLNDATAIVLFNILLAIALEGTFGWDQGFYGVLEFLRVFFGGALVGFGFGALLSWLMKRMTLPGAGWVLMSLITAYSAFIIAEHSLHLSGVMAVTAAALTLGVLGLPELPRESGHALVEAWEVLALGCNTLLFLMVGLFVQPGQLIQYMPAILLAVLLVHLARGSVIYTMVPLAVRWFRLPKVTMGERHVMWWGGLKGGLAIAIVLSIPTDMPAEDRSQLLAMTLGVVMFTLLINAPTIRPLMRWLGMERLTADENAELCRGLGTGHSHATAMLDRFLDSGLLSPASHHRVQGRLDDVLSQELCEVTAEDLIRREHLNLLRRELDTAEDLYKAGIVPQYIYLDLRSELTRNRERIAEPERAVPEGQQALTFLARLEHAVIARLREKDWAAGLLAGYQRLRVSQHLLRSIAHLLMSESALKQLTAGHGGRMAEHAALEKLYEGRVQLYREEVATVRRDFPEFFQRFEERLALRAALVTAREEIEEEARHGSLGAKPMAVLERQIGGALASIPVAEAAEQGMPTTELLAMVPLFSNVSPEVLEAMANRVQVVHFLPGDTCIAEGQQGDALYVIVQGRVEVSRRGPDNEEQVLAELEGGNFFGEMALLGAQIRNATVRALEACTLLRLTRSDVLKIADRHGAFARTLINAEQDRGADSTDTRG